MTQAIGLAEKRRLFDLNFPEIEVVELQFWLLKHREDHLLRLSELLAPLQPLNSFSDIVEHPGRCILRGEIKVGLLFELLEVIVEGKAGLHLESLKFQQRFLVQVSLFLDQTEFVCRLFHVTEPLVNECRLQSRIGFKRVQAKMAGLKLVIQGHDVNSIAPFEILRGLA